MACLSFVEVKPVLAAAINRWLEYIELAFGISFDNFYGFVTSQSDVVGRRSFIIIRSVAERVDQHAFQAHAFFSCKMLDKKR